MSSSDRVTLALVTQLAQVADGALFGVGLAYIAVRSLIKCIRTSNALKKIRDAPSVSVSDLRSILPSPAEESSETSRETVVKGSDGGGGGGEVLVVVRGTVDSKSSVEGGWMNGLFSSGQNAVIIQKTQSCIYNGLVGIVPWPSDVRSILTRAWREESSYTRSVPFVLKQGGQQSPPSYLLVNMEGSKHPLPLVTVYHQMQPISATPYTFVQALFGQEYAVGLLDEEKILPTGKDITAVGFCSIKDGVPEIKACNDLPYFLSDMSKNQMIVDLSFKTKVLMWTSIVVGSVSLGVLGYAIVRNWNRWKNRQQQARTAREQARELELSVAEDEEPEEVPEGQLCVLCLARRRQSAFVPCGHLVCCQRCAHLIEREENPKCPVCRQAINNSVRIYAS